MNPAHSVLFVSFLLSAGLASALGYAVWQYRPRKGSTWLSVTALAFLPWGVGEAIISLRPTLSLALVGSTLSLAGVAMIPVSWLLFASAYTGRDDWLTGPRALALWTVPALFVLSAFLNPLELVVADPQLRPSGDLAFSWGPLSWVSFAIFHGMMAVGNAFLVSKAIRSRNVYRQRTSFLLFINVTLSVIHIGGLLGTSPTTAQQLLPLVFLGMGALSLLVIYNYRFLELLPVERAIGFLGSRFADITPIARDIVIEEMGSGVVVIDKDNRIVDLNPVARRMLDAEDARIVGRRIQEVIDTDVMLEDDVGFLDPDVTEGQFTEIWAESTDGQRRCYDVVITDLSDKRDDVSGRVAIIHDVTEKQRRKQQLKQQAAELERQNDHLEEFASAVSHDLRSPLNVAEGNVIRALETSELDPLEKTRESHQRMEAIIDDVLTLARQGQTVDERHTVSLADVVSQAWDSVETGDATLEIDVDEKTTLEADVTRLQQVLENLFRNAIEHGSTNADSEARQARQNGGTQDGPAAGPDSDEPEHDPLALTVGRFETGFFLADDGDGIPPEERDRVIEEGYTTSEDGTGFGLSIVKTIVEAHGWDLQVTEGEDGGARFEITDVWDDRLLGAEGPVGE